MGVVTPLCWLVLLMANNADMDELYSPDPDAAKIAKLYHGFWKNLSVKDVYNFSSNNSPGPDDGNNDRYKMNPGQMMNIINTIARNDTTMQTDSNSQFAPRRLELRFT